jgi:aquaporin related protein
MYPTPSRFSASLSSGTSFTQGLFIEAICTAMLVFTIIMLAKEKHRATYIAPIGIGLAMFIGELASVNFTGGALNPARWLGPAAVTKTFMSSDWIYAAGPIIGAVLAVVFYKLFKVME